MSHPRGININQIPQVQRRNSSDPSTSPIPNPSRQANAAWGHSRETLPLRGKQTPRGVSNPIPAGHRHGPYQPQPKRGGPRPAGWGGAPQGSSPPFTPRICKGGSHAGTFRAVARLSGPRAGPGPSGHLFLSAPRPPFGLAAPASCRASLRSGGGCFPGKSRPCPGATRPAPQTPSSLFSLGVRPGPVSAPPHRPRRLSYGHRGAGPPPGTCQPGPCPPPFPPTSQFFTLHKTDK